MQLQNEAPVISQITLPRQRPVSLSCLSDTVQDPIDAEEIFQLIRDIKDPEHPLSLEQLSVIQMDHIFITMPPITSAVPIIRVEFTPTIPHCSMATLIGLCIRVKLMRSFPFYYKIDVYIRKGTHNSEDAINKQLNDKERVAAALENSQLLFMVEQSLAGLPSQSTCC